MIYVYGLADRRAAPLKAAGHAIRFVEVEGVFAAVESMTERPAVSEETLRAQHEIVSRLATRVDALLPARFGALVDEAELAAVVRQRRGAIQAALDLVRGRVQMTLRLFADGPPELPLAPVPPPAARTGTSYLQQRRAAAAGQPVPAEVSRIDAAVAHLVLARRDEPGRGRVALAVYHLIERDSEPAYLEALAPLRGETMTVSGPWPPFAFVPELWP
jgi:hypothetical protein